MVGERLRRGRVMHREPGVYPRGVAIPADGFGEYPTWHRFSVWRREQPWESWRRYWSAPTRADAEALTRGLPGEWLIIGPGCPLLNVVG